MEPMVLKISKSAKKCSNTKELNCLNRFPLLKAPIIKKRPKNTEVELKNYKNCASHKNCIYHKGYLHTIKFEQTIKPVHDVIANLHAIKVMQVIKVVDIIKIIMHAMKIVEVIKTLYSIKIM